MYEGNYNYNYQLSRNIWLQEFIVSYSRPDLAQKIRFNELDGIKAQYMTGTILQPTRDCFNNEENPTGKENKLIISSGKCSEELNLAIGRELTSEHNWEGPRCAVDFIIQGVDSKAVFERIRTHLPHAFGQLIYYPGRHIHVSLPTRKHQGEALIYSNGEYIEAPST